MRLDGRRESSNVEDRRGLSGKAVAGGGIGAVIIAALLTRQALLRRSRNWPPTVRRFLLRQKMSGERFSRRWEEPIHRRRLCCSRIR